MFTLIVENQKGEQIELTHNPNYAIVNISGLTPAAAMINSSVMGGFDGEKFSSSRVGKRNIVITVQLVRDAEKSRLKLYQFFRPKSPCRLFYKNSSRDVYIDGYVETFDGDLFELGQKAQISITALSHIFFEYKTAGNISRINSLFWFPFPLMQRVFLSVKINTEGSTNVINDGDVETGVIIKLTATGKVIDLSYITQIPENFPLPNTVMVDGGRDYINTNPGEKKVILTSKVWRLIFFLS